MYQISNPFSAAQTVPKNPSNPEALRNHFATSQFFYGEELFSPSHNHQAGGSLLVGCPRLLIRPSNLEAISSIRNPRTCHAVVTGNHIT